MTGLVLLDLLANFDTEDHPLLLHGLQHRFGISGSALNWVTSYLSPHAQSVYLNGRYSSDGFLTCDVSQGFKLAPLSLH